MKRLLLSIALAATLALPMAAHADSASSSPPSPEEDTTAPMPLDLALAKKLPVPEPLASLQKVIGTPGGIYTPEGIEGGGEAWQARPGDVWYRWWHDCGEAMSFGDAIVRSGQVMTLWFQGCAAENIIRMSNGDFHVVDPHGKITQLAETPKEKAYLENQHQAMGKIDRQYRSKVGVPCAMMALTIEGIAEEHLTYPHESRDELVALVVGEALQNSQVVSQNVSTEEWIRRFGNIVDYVESHPDVTPKQARNQFTTDCLNRNLPW